MNKVIKSLPVINRQDTKTYPCEIVRLTPADWQQVFALQQEVVDQLPSAELYFPLTINEIQEVLGDRGITLGAVVNGKIIGFSSILFPAAGNDPAGFDLELPAAESAKIAYLKVTNVQPHFRGNSLQKQFLSCLLATAAQRDNWLHLCSTVSPKNYASIVSTFSLGLVIVKLKRKYRNYWRYIFYRQRAARFEPDNGKTEVVFCENIERQVQLLQQGYYGYEAVMKQNQPGIVFGRQKQGCRKLLT